MTYKRFENKPVGKEAIRFGHGVYALVKDRAFSGQGDLRDQLRRASRSVSKDIAEGVERGTTNELIYHLYIARGSAGEVRSALWFAIGLDDTTHLSPAIRPLIAQGESISKQLHAWANSLQNTDIAGPRHPTEQSLADYQQQQRATAFLKKLQDIRTRTARWANLKCEISNLR